MTSRDPRVARGNLCLVTWVVGHLRKIMTKARCHRSCGYSAPGQMTEKEKRKKKKTRSTLRPWKDTYYVSLSGCDGTLVYEHVLIWSTYDATNPIKIGHRLGFSPCKLQWRLMTFMWPLTLIATDNLWSMVERSYWAILVVDLICKTSSIFSGIAK